MALPPPLPPEDRTVGQLIAETVRLYGRRFWASLALGVPLAVADQLSVGATRVVAIFVLIVFASAFSAAYAAAVGIVAGARFSPRDWLRAITLGTLVFVPAALVLPWFALLGFAWLALFGLAVPVTLLEHSGARASLARALRLARADYVHALGGLAALVLVYFLGRVALAFVLRDQGDQTERIALFLADLVLSPMLYIGAALLYTDQSARLIRSASPQRPRRRRRHADLHPADDAHGAGRSDAEVQSGEAARSQP